MTLSLMSQIPCGGSNNIGGRVYMDVNYNSLDDEILNPVADVTVTAYDAFGNVVHATQTAIDGSYILVVPDGKEVRVEFAGLPADFYPSFSGSQSHTTTQFVTSPSCDANLGINSADCACEDVPSLVTPCWVSGPASSGPNDAALLTYTYDQMGPGANYATVPPTAGAAGLPTSIASWAEVGTLWGVAVDKATGTVFAGAALRRHSGVGPQGYGGIYRVDDPNGSALLSDYLDVNGCSSTGTITRSLNPSKNQPSFDQEGHGKAGKMSLGDLELSPDGMFLYTVNLNTKELIQIQIRNTLGGNIISPSCAQVNAYPIPNVSGCVGADSRPWGLATKGDKVYVGSICSAESTQNFNDLAADVHEFSATTLGFTSMFTAPIDLSSYTFKGCVLGYQSPRFPNQYCCEWNPWLPANDYSFTESAEWAGAICHPQPILADIEFDESGSMILGFQDRFGLQSGWQNYYNADGGRLLNGLTGGDILYAYYDKGADEYVVNLTTNEVLDASGNVVRNGCGFETGQGRGEEYYCGDSNGPHPEGALGALAMKKGSDILAHTVLDAGLAVDQTTYPLGYGSGVNYITNSGGFWNADYYAVYYNGLSNTLGKAAGLGDLELLCAPTPIEIGNRVWVDVNKNGRQDPSEPPLANINVSLYDMSGSVIATTMTDADGLYIFNQTTNATGLTFGEMYWVVIDDYVPGVGLPGTDLQLTLNDAPNTNDINDSDGLEDGASGIGAIGNKPYTKVNLGSTLQNNHSYDFGFAPTSCSILIDALV